MISSISIGLQTCGESMRVSNLLAVVAASSLVSTPVMAHPAVPRPIEKASQLSANAAPLSLSNAAGIRAKTSAQRVNQQAGGFPFLIVFVVVAAGLGLYFAIEDDESDSP